MNTNETLIDHVAKVAAETALQFLHQEKQKQAKSKKDRRLRNTKLLLRNYRSFVLHCADIKLDIVALNEKLELDELDTDYFAIESIKKSKERTLAMVKFINQMLEVYRILCEKSNKPEDLRRYSAVYQMYISEGKMTAEQISAGHKTNVRTVYKDLDKAFETLSSLMFGVDSIQFMD